MVKIIQFRSSLWSPEAKKTFFIIIYLIYFARVCVILFTQQNYIKTWEKLGSLNVTRLSFRFPSAYFFLLVSLFKQRVQSVKADNLKSTNYAWGSKGCTSCHGAAATLWQSWAHKETSFPICHDYFRSTTQHSQWCNAQSNSMQPMSDI